MSDLERRLRAAMLAATERPPANLLQEVRRRHRRHVRRVSAACAAVVAAFAIAVPPVAHALRTGPRPGIHPAGPATTPTASAKSTGSSPYSCQPDVGALTANWRDSSLQAGPIWFAYARTQGYVHLSGSPDAPRSAHRGTGQLAVGVMIVEVDYGSRVVLTVAPSVRMYFRFLDGFAKGGPYSLADGVDSLTLAGCPPGTPSGDNGRVSDYYLGFVIRIGSDAPADVSTSASTRPIQVFFTCLRLGCDT
jgi:hypothetical protein